MKNLKKMVLKELSNQEMSELEGGALFKAKSLLVWMFGGNSSSDVEIEIFGLEIK